MEEDKEKVLTAENLKSMPSNTIFAQGEGYIKHPWWSQWEYERQLGAHKTVDENGMTKVKWVAITGAIGDWAIYHSLDANFVLDDYLDGDSHLRVSFEKIARGGAKLYEQEEIKRLVPCDDEAFAKYRY